MYTLHEFNDDGSVTLLDSNDFVLALNFSRCVSRCRYGISADNVPLAFFVGGDAKGIRNWFYKYPNSGYYN